MAITLFRCQGGVIVLPNCDLVLVDREDGGNLVVNPPRDVWERSELSPTELKLWSQLVAATGKAMLTELPQLLNGCVNYWEAGNWALNEEAAPRGSKNPVVHRRVHLHLLGRSRNSKSSSWKWGEAPKFPDYADRLRWASSSRQLNGDECMRVITRTEQILNAVYGMNAAAIQPWS